MELAITTHLIELAKVSRKITCNVLPTEQWLTRHSRWCCACINDNSRSEDFGCQVANQHQKQLSLFELFLCFLLLYHFLLDWTQIWKNLFGLTSLLFPPHWKNSLRIPMVRSWASPFGIEPWAWGEKRNSPCDHPSSSFTWGSILVENRKTGGNSVCMSNGKKEMWWSGGCNWVDLGCAKLQTCGTSKQAKW